MRSAIALALLAVVSTALACALPGRLATSSRLPDFSEAVDPSTEPLRVNLTTDEARSVSAEIPVEGGFLTTTAANGTTFTLEIPSDALLQPTTITMTPIASMDGLPTSGGLAAAVEFAPDGLVLYEVATLTIDLAEPLPLDQQLPIGVSGQEHDLELAFSEVQGDSLQLQLLHFSSAGVAKGTLADLEPVRQRLGGDVEARLRSILAWYVADYRQRSLAGEDATVPMALWDWFRNEWYDKVLKPRLAAAKESCAAGRLALLTYVEFQRSLQLLGHPEAAQGFEQEILALIPDIVRKCIQEEYELCRDDHIVHHILLAITEIERQVQLMGLEGAGIESAMAEARQLAAKCLRFELKFESEVNGSATLLENTTSVMSSTVLLLYDPETGKITGEGSLENTTFDVGGYRRGPGMTCTVTGIPAPTGTLAVTGLGFVVQHNGPDDLLGYVADVVLGYQDNPDEGTTGEGFSGTCTAFGVTLSMDETDLGFWSAGFMDAHTSEVPVGETAVGGLYNAKGWTVEGDELFAELEWDRSGLVTEKGFFQLYHRPE